MITIPYGLLPTPSMLHPRAVGVGVGTGDLLAVMRASLRRHGPNDGVLAMLNVLGFTWGPPPTVSDLDLDVASVAEALDSPVAPRSDAGQLDRALEPGPSPFVAGRQTVPGTTRGAAGEQLYPAHASRRVGELAALLGGGR